MQERLNIYSDSITIACFKIRFANIYLIGEKFDRMRNKVVITGTGVVSSIGIGTQEYFNSLKTGTCNIEKSEFGSIEVPAALVHIKEVGLKGRNRKVAECAFEEAVTNAGVTPEQLSSPKTGVVLGTMNGTGTAIIDKFNELSSGDVNAYTKYELGNYRYNSITDYLCSKFKILGERVTISNACATGISIIQRAKELIECGYCDICIVVGVDLVNILSILPLYTLRIIDMDTVKPFDKNRKGTVLGDGAGVLVLESLDHAQRRKAPILAEIMGISIKNDIFDTFFSSSKDGIAIISAMKEAIEMSNITIKDIDYINAHGTGTPQNDVVETNAIKAVFKERASCIPISSTKSFIGHTGAASGILEVIAGLMAICNGVIHPTLHYSEKDSECDLYYVPNEAICKEVNYFLSNSIGFGGVNASIVISKYFGG